MHPHLQIQHLRAISIASGRFTNGNATVVWHDVGGITFLVGNQSVDGQLILVNFGSCKTQTAFVGWSGF